MSLLKEKLEADTLTTHYWEPSLDGSNQKRTGNNPQSNKFVYPMFRNVIPGIIFIITGLGSTITGYFVTTLGVGIGAATSVLISGLIITLSSVCTLVGIYIAATKLTVEINPKKVTVTRHILGLPFKKSIATSSIADIKLITKVNRSHDKVLGVVCRLNLILKNGRYLGVGDSLYNVTEAQAIQEKMITQLGPPWKRCLPGDSKHDFRNTGPGLLGSLLVMLKVLIIFAFVYDVMAP